MGVRMALGATASNVVRGVLRQGMWLTAGGLVAGMAGALAATRLMGSMLYGIGSTDPRTYLSVTGVIVATALAACLIPAWRASNVDPMVTLREE